MALVPARRPRPHTLILGLLAVFCLIEAWLTFGGNEVRYTVYERFAFSSWQFRAQTSAGLIPEAWGRAISYAFLHGGWLHLLMNGLATVTLGDQCVRVMGPRKFGVFFVVTAIASAVAFAVLNDTAAPLVGASGALFGYLGALKRWELRLLVHHRMPWKQPMLRFAAEMIGLNALLYFATGGLLAWEAHLGGFIAGWLLAPWSARA